MAAHSIFAQMPGRLPSLGGLSNTSQKTDSLKQRDDQADSITIFFRFFDSSRVLLLDSSIGEFSKRFSVPPQNIYLGSLGAASRSLLFQPILKPGFDAGFHAFDVYKLALKDTRIFQTTRPYSELEYYLGTLSEQTIKALFTQNITPLWNASFEFRFVNSPGYFNNNSGSHTNMRFSSGFSTKNRRYSGFFAYIGNTGKVGQNGGILNTSYITGNEPVYLQQRLNIPTWLGADRGQSRNFFASDIGTGFTYKEQSLYFRHQYDLGQKDSIFNELDSTYLPVFYARLRLQHFIAYTARLNRFSDSKLTDTSATNEYANIYRNHFGVNQLHAQLYAQDKWHDLTNEFALLAYPQKNNQDQFLKVGMGFQALAGFFDSTQKKNYSNLYMLGEYRNRTRNKRWDINASGKLYVNGFNAGDYAANLSLLSQVGKKAGAILLGFSNVNREPGFVFNQQSNFINQTQSAVLKKENWTHLSVQYFLPLIKTSLQGNYYMVTNYTYWKSYTTYEQEASLLPILHAGIEKQFKLTRRLNLYSSLHVQTEGTKAINLPLAFTQNRLAFEGNFFKNLWLSTGVEVRYFTPHQMDDFSPFHVQWVVQEATTIKNLPDIAAYLNFRIRSFRLYFRIENLNTLDVTRGFQFVNNNYAAPLYPTPGLFTRFGIYWSFVN